MSRAKSPYCSADEYLALERDSVVRHEYLDGQIYEMAGESLQHSQICVNLIGEVRSQLKGRECQVLSPNMKIRTGESKLFSYPDLTVVCGEPMFHDRHGDILLNPVVIFEVLSASAEAYDRGEKFLRYRNHIATLTDYVLVSQRRPVIEHLARRPDGQWLFSDAEGLSASLFIDSIGCRLDLAEVYARVVIAPLDPLPEA